MAKSNIEDYIDELKGISTEAKDIDLYSLKRELVNLDESSKVFGDFEKNAMVIDKEVLSQVQNLGSLVKIRNLASEIKNKGKINEKLHSLHFKLNLLKDASVTDVSTIKNMLNVFLYNNESKIDNIINELNDFKTKLDGLKKCQSDLFPKSLDNKLKIESKYGKYIEQLHLIHARQKNALASTIRLFLKFAKRYIKNLHKFK